MKQIINTKKETSLFFLAKKETSFVNERIKIIFLTKGLFVSTDGGRKDCNIPLILHGILSVNSPCAHSRLRGSLVIAVRAFISKLDPQNQLIFLISPLSYCKTEFCPPSPSLELSSFPLLIIQSFQPSSVGFMLHVRSLGRTSRFQAKAYSSSFLLNPCRVDPDSCCWEIVCMFLLTYRWVLR